MRIAKPLAALCLAALLLGLAGCKRTNIAPNLGRQLDEWQQAGKTDPNLGEPVEIDPAAGSDFTGVLGFSVTGLPQTDTLAPAKFYALDDRFAQVEYHLPAAEEGPDPQVLVVRVAPAEASPLSNTYNEPHGKTDETVTIDGIAVRRRTSTEGCALDTWQRGDFQYSLHSNKLQGPVPQGTLEILVAGLNAEWA